MSDGKIYVDANQPATLNNGGAYDDCSTLQEAVMACTGCRPIRKSERPLE